MRNVRIIGVALPACSLPTGTTQAPAALLPALATRIGPRLLIRSKNYRGSLQHVPSRVAISSVIERCINQNTHELSFILLSYSSILCLFHPPATPVQQDDSADESAGLRSSIAARSLGGHYVADHELLRCARRSLAD